MLKQVVVFLAVIGFLNICCRIAAADQIAFKYGVGILLPDPGKPQVKVFSLSKQGYLGFGLTEQVEAGVFADQKDGEGRRSGGFGFYSLGSTVNAAPFRLQALWGAGAITSPDSRLGSVFQFAHDLCLSLYNRTTEESIGVCYKHISNAGLASPNKGRDFILMRMGFNF